MLTTAAAHATCHVPQKGDEMKKYFLGLVILMLGTYLGCAQKVDFQARPMVPASDVTAKVTRDRNENAKINLDIDHLAQPQSLVPPRALYVVWAETPQGRTINLGRLKVNDNRSAKFEGVTPLEKFRLLITAEDQADALVPSRQIVLATEMFRVKDSWW
jgi:hypothetical protein